MATEINISIVKNDGGVDKSRTFLFEEGEIKVTNRPNVGQAVSLSIAKDGAADDTEDFVMDLGVKKTLSFEWKLYKQDNDRSNGTHNSTWFNSGVPAGTIKTYQEMLDYLEYIMGFPGLGIVNYVIEITDKYRTTTDIYSFEDFNIDVNSGIYPTGNFKFNWKKRVV